MTHPDDDVIENLLRTTFEGPVVDGGFADRVMRRLPPRRRRITWPTLAGVAAGAGACWLSLSSAPLLSAGWHDWMNGELSAQAVALLLAATCASLAACCWTLAEADDR
ncbi:MAG TPA: hypothetical protein VHE32_04180 [Rhodanobacteraceae bacterium]|jgi:hypothetical protein|nr:hypothetical protein [Rhodanobacteraceae bacterium]